MEDDDADERSRQGVPVEEPQPVPVGGEDAIQEQDAPETEDAPDGEDEDEDEEPD